jgi:Tfp pilus assembly protein PilV
MAQSPFSNPLSGRYRNDVKGSRGFTIVEVMVAAFILIVGLSAVAGVIASTLGNTTRSEFMTQAATLATEKLEDLNRYPSADPNVAVTSGTSVGSLTSHVPQYYDEVYFSPTEGSMTETTTGVDSSGNTQYTTVIYTPDGRLTSSTSSTNPAIAGASTIFLRQWLIEANTPVTGVRRITVLVSVENQQLQPPVTFQMSTVRP